MFKVSNLQPKVNISNMFTVSNLQPKVNISNEL